MSTQKQVVTRYQKNLILARDDVPYPVATVRKAGTCSCDWVGVAWIP